MTLETFRDETLSFPQTTSFTHGQTSFATPSRLFLPELQRKKKPHLSTNRVIGAVVTFDGACEALVAFA